MKVQPAHRKLNRTLTRWVIKLHQKGYTDDFLPAGDQSLECIQNGERFRLRDLKISIVDCSYDLLTKTFKYIHTIDTQVGCRGLLITNESLSNPC